MKFAAIALIGLGLPAAADDSVDALLALAGDAEYGEYLASECTGCHQASGATDGIPAIVGWDEEPFRLSMLDYKQGLRQHPVMNMIAGRLSDEEIAALSAYFGGLTPTESQ